MGRTEVNVFLVAMAILPFLQDMLLHRHWTLYTCHIIFRHNCSDKIYSRHFRKNFSRDYSLHTESATQRKPLSWTSCSTLMWWMWTRGGKWWDIDPKMGVKGEQYMDMIWWSYCVHIIYYIYYILYFIFFRLYIISNILFFYSLYIYIIFYILYIIFYIL